MVRKIFLEEVCDRERLKSFINRIFKLTRLHITPFNERGDVVIGDIEKILPGLTDATEIVDYPTSELLERPDGSFLRVMKLNHKGTSFGAVLIGPFFKIGSKHEEDAEIPEITNEQLQGTEESVESFFDQMADLAAEKTSLARKEKILSVLEHASTVMNSSLEFQNLLEFVMDIAIEITGGTGGSLLLRKDESESLEVVAARGKYPHEVKKIRVDFGQGISGWVAEHKESLNIPNVLLDTRYIETPESIYSEMAMPLLIGDKLVGVIVVDSSEINAFSNSDELSLNTLASMVSRVLENSRLLADSNQKLRELTKVFSISEKLSVRSLDREGYDQMLKEACEATDSSASSLMLFNSDLEELTMCASYGLPDELNTLAIGLGKGYHGWVAANKKTLLIADAIHDGTIVHVNFLDQFAKSMLIVPLITADNRFVGTLAIYHCDSPKVITESDQDLLNTIGRIITSHFENERLFNDSRRKLDYLSTLYKVGSSVSRTLNISKLFETILQQVQEVMDVENCSLMAYNPSKKVLTLDAAIGLPSNMVGRIEVKSGEGIAGWVAQNKKPVLLKDISKDDRFSNHQGRLDYKTRSVLSVPILLHDNKLLGVLNVNNKRNGDAFLEDDLNLLLGISGQISQAIANANLHEKTDMQVAELSLIQELGKAINSSLDLDSVLNYFIDMTTRITEADCASLMLYDDSTNELYVEVHRGFDDESINDFRLKLGEGIAGKAAATHKPIRLDDTGTSKDYQDFGQLSARNLTLMSAPLVNKDNLIGVINCERKKEKKGPFTAENLDLLETLASQASIAIENARLYHNLLNVYLETIRSLAAAIDAKDSYTHGHSRRVTDLSVGIALEMNLPKSEVDTIRHASLLHDVGKIGISEKILLKPGRLTDDEFETIKSHPYIGAGILNSIEFLHSVCEIIKHHHERYDGKGYPDKLAGEEIPLGARIICVADSFDAITSCRPYRKPLTFDEATEEVKRCSGTQFDPEVAAAFVRLRTSKHCPPWFRGDLLDQSLADQYPLQL